MVLRPSSSVIILGGLLFLVTLSRSVHGHNEPYTDDPYLQSQFLKPAEEIEAAGEKFKDDHADITESETKVWYRSKITTDEEIVQRKWRLIKTGPLYETSSDSYHQLDDVKLTFSFPYFGRLVNNLTLSSSGAVLLGNQDAPIHVASHIAPLLSSLPPGNDRIKFKDTGTKFIVHWKFHHILDIKRPQEVQLWIYQDGSMTILYQHLLREVLDLAQSSTNDPVLIGLRDGWAVEPTEGSNVVSVFRYPPIYIEPEKLVGNWTMLQFFPSPLNPLCQQIANERECRANEKCTWCNGGQCLYKMEGKRLENDCSNDPMQDDAQDDIARKCNQTSPCEFDDNTPVCGTNGITYDNECFLERLACTQGLDIKVESEGVCHRDEEGEEDCPTLCTTDYKPVCGSNGKTYSNRCNLKAYQCSRKEHLKELQEEEVTLSHEGECGQDYDYGHIDSEDDDKEDEDGNDEDSGGQPNPLPATSQTENSKCKETCDRMFDPVCLNKIRQFSNKCVMDAAVCREKIQVNEFFKGYCSSSDASSQDSHPNEVSDSQRKGNNRGDNCLDLPVGCPKILAPVCASNGQTYESECIFRQIVCASSMATDLDIVRPGSCEDDPEPERGINLSNVENDDKAVDDDGRDEDGPISDCEEIVCTREMNTICGNDGKTYNNPCLLEAAAKCKHGLVMAYQGSCKSVEAIEKANAIPAVPDEEESPEHQEHHTSNFVKGLTFLTIVVAISLIAVAGIKLYRRSKSNFPPARQGEQIGIPNNISVVNHGGSGSSDSVGSGIVPVTQTQTIGASSTGASGVELSIVTGGTPRQVAKYDKLPLVPNIEEDVVR